MKTITRTKQFRQDYRKNVKSVHDLHELLQFPIEKLKKGETLPKRYKDHSLTGNWRDHREFHIKPDLIVIYSLNDVAVTLVRIGSHNACFG